MSKPNIHEIIAESPLFTEVIQKKSRILWILSIVSLTYYFALVVGAAYYRPAFASILFWQINFGMLFALSQYLFAGGIAFIYAHYMKKIDSSMQSILKANPT
jgi:uncharacterized membrane protein (DUF485 family)